RALSRERFRLEVRQEPARNPLFWTGVLSNTVIYLLLREDQPLGPRVAALGKTAPAHIARELVTPAAAQVRQLSQLYGAGLSEFAAPADPAARKTLASAGATAAKALDGFARFLSGLEQKASGSPRLGADYAQALRIDLEVEDSPQALIPRFERDLAGLRREAAEYGRTVY